MTKGTYLLIILTAILFIAAIAILLKQFFEIRAKDQAFDNSVEREKDCVAFSYSAKAKGLSKIKADIYEAKKSGMTPILPLKKSHTFEKTQEYNAVSTY